MRAVVLLFLLPTCYGSLYDLIYGTEQSVGVEGTLSCNKKPAAGVEVLLYDKRPALLDRSVDVLHSGKTDAFGNFKLGGTERVHTAKPQLRIQHGCNYKPKGGLCWKRKNVVIPSKYIVQGNRVKEYYDIGHLDLAKKKWDEGFAYCIPPPAWYTPRIPLLAQTVTT
ncbi:hypothetical protein Y032_0359g3423 [Ancylostoma ceylanicum]|uniref:Transthyretin-like family protein n=1 Tax=Ancylostoma ceylanicum TaxID=53326 RepID=A0A016RVW6_9BILA|nr:hypothetical protein Y032_0359g3423 [Ancylostoma ceylanicum]